MPRVLIRNRDLVAVCNAASVLEAWLVPGTLSWRVGQIARALLLHAEPLGKQMETLLDSFVEHEGDGQLKRRKMVEVLDDAYLTDEREPNGQRKVQQVVGKELVYTDKAEYERRRDELQNERVEVDIPKLLTDGHCAELAKDRVKQHPTDAQGRPLPSPSFSALACVMEGTAVLAPVATAA